MATRSTGSATLTFGLVSVPIKFYTATSSHDPAFNTMHLPCKAKVRQPAYVCTACGDEVPRDTAGKGYEYAKGQYVIFTPEEFKSFAEPASPAIEIEEFVPIEQVDPVCFEGAVHVGPDKGAGRSYRLLAEAMAKTGKAAVGKFASRGRDKLVLIRVVNNRLMLHSLYYADELRAADDIVGEAAAPKADELKLAVKLIENLSSDRFDLAAYEDGYVARVMQAVEQKAAGQSVSITPTKPTAQIVDLMAALKASVDAQPAARKSAKRKAA